MRQLPKGGINKEAAIRPKNLRHLEGMIRRSGAKNPARQISNLAKGDKGLVHGAASWAANKVPGLRKIDSGINNQLDKVRRRALDFDIRAGSKLTRGKPRNSKMRKAFTNKHNIEMGSGARGRDFREIEVPSMFAPIDKAKGKALPLIGSFAAINKLEDMRPGNKKQEEGRGDENMKLAAFNREEAIEKIASKLSSQESQKEHEEKKEKTKNLEKIASEEKQLLSKASSMLKQASEEIRSLRYSNEKLANECKKYEAAFIAKNRSERSVKLAKEMMEKGIIKTAEFNEKVDEIMSYDESTYDVLKSTINEIEKSASEDDSFNDLTFLSLEGNIKGKEQSGLRASMEDAINKIASEIE